MMDVNHINWHNLINIHLENLILAFDLRTYSWSISQVLVKLIMHTIDNITSLSLPCTIKKGSLLMTCIIQQCWLAGMWCDSVSFEDLSSCGATVSCCCCSRKMMSLFHHSPSDEKGMACRSCYTHTHTHTHTHNNIISIIVGGRIEWDELDW